MRDVDRIPATAAPPRRPWDRRRPLKRPPAEEPERPEEDGLSDDGKGDHATPGDSPPRVDIRI
jgi:hypothetical protein